MKLSDFRNTVDGIDSICLLDKTGKLISSKPAMLTELWEHGSDEIKGVELETYMSVSGKPCIRAHIYLEA